MPSHAELAGKLLVDAAEFFKSLAAQNPDLQEQMSENAGVFEQVSALVVNEPQGNLNGAAHNELAGRLLKDAAEFFTNLAEQNESIKDQMSENANVFIQVADLVIQNPLGVME